MLWLTSTRLCSIIRVSHSMHGLCYVSHALYLNHIKGLFVMAVFPVFIYLLLCGTWLMGNHTFTMIVTHCLLHCLQNWCRHRIFLLLFYYNYLHVYFLQMCSSDSSQSDNNEALIQYRPRA